MKMTKRLIAVLTASVALFALAGCGMNASSSASTPKDYAQIIHDARPDEDNENQMILATDGCCPDHRERARRGFRMAEPLKQTLRGNLETLRAYGARLTSADRLDQAVKRAMAARFSVGAAGGKDSPQHRAANPIRLKGRVIGGQQLAGCPSGSTVWVEPHALITQLAADDARRRGITIRKET